MDDNYSWVKFYEKLAIGLGAFEKDRDTLLKWIYASLSEFTNYLHQPNHSKLSDIDPFTVIGTFNRHISVENKKRIAQEFKSFLQLDELVPENFAGIPPLSNENSMFFGFKDGKTSQDIQNLWDIFIAATRNPGRVGPLFNAMTKHQYGIKFNLTLALYWIDPNHFFPLDGPSRKVLQKIGVNIKDKVPSFDQYMSIVSKVRVAQKAGTLYGSTFPQLTRWISEQLHNKS